MSAESRMATRTVIELLLTVTGWGLVITAIAMFIMGKPGPGIGFIVGAVIVFWVSASSFKRKPTGHYAADEMNKAIRYLKQAQYPQALAAAEKAAGIALSVEELRPGASSALLLVSTAKALTGDIGGARAALDEARKYAARYPELGEDLRPLADSVAKELDLGVPNAKRLVNRVLEVDGN